MADESENRVFFDEDFKTFRLYPGKSLYAFCISPELSLEHLYWGKTLHEGYDLRYLSESTRMTCFSTSELYESRTHSAVEVENFDQAETIEEILEVWRKNRTSNSAETIQQRRMDNLSWRLMATTASPPTSSITSSNKDTIKAGFFSTGSNKELQVALEKRRTAAKFGKSDAPTSTPSSPALEHPGSPEAAPELTKLAVETKKDESTLFKPSPSLPSSPSMRRSLSLGLGPYHQSQSASATPLSGSPRFSRSKAWSSTVALDHINEQEIERQHASKEGFTRSPRPSRAEGLRIDPNAPFVVPDFTQSARATPPQQTPINRTKTSNMKNGIRAYDRTGGKIGKGTLCVEYSDHGTGDFRSPSFTVIDNCNGSSISPLRYRKHLILRGKLPMPDGLPGIRSTDESEASTLIVTMADVGSGLEVDLIYVVLHDYDAVMRRAVFRNVDTRTAQMGGRAGKVVQRACSFTVDFESASAPFHMLQLSGSWGRERYMVETKLTHGMQSFGSMRGVSGHQHNPFAVVTVGPPSETQGEVKGFSLIYSGNFIFEAELGEMGRLRTNMGIHPMGLLWHLKQGGVFNTPEAVLVRSDEGLGGMSRVLHRLFLDKLIPPTWADSGPAPVLLNTWEARYFNVNHANVVEMAKQASRVGIDLIVLDDGWFGKRNDITTSLGDWTADLTKFPMGLKGLAEDVNAAGCKFGLWVEPEMVSEDSLLHGMHPDWYLTVPGRPRQIGRNQFVLDLSRKEVRDYLFDAISAILSNANIEYVKWDMNRPLTEVFSQRDIVHPPPGDFHDYTKERDFNAAVAAAAVWQSETSHRFVLGLYELQGRITKAFPHILLENCSSGGGRFDPGMLFFSPQIWCSDNTDALARMKIQYGTSLAYPARCVGAHVSCVPNHITGNTTRVRTRGFVAMCGTFGFELDICAIGTQEKLLFKDLISCYRAYAPIIRTGDLYRLWDPFKNTFAAWMYVTRDKSEAVVFAFSLNSDHWSNLVPRLALQGLLPDAIYEIGEPLPNNVCQSSGNLRIVETEVPVYQLGYSTVCLTGQILMSAGLPVKFYTLDDSVMFTVSRVPPSYAHTRSRQNSVRQHEAGASNVTFPSPGFRPEDEIRR